jgi:predicted phosphodiesterase
MRLAILGDTHFGMRGDSIAFHNHYREFYTKIFFPYLVQNGITIVFQMGDLFDRRKYISFQSLALCHDYFFNELVKNNIELHTLLGNHDITYRNTLEVNSPELLLKHYTNIKIYNQPASWHGIDIIPWICKENEQDINEFIYESKNSICFGHFELAGFEMNRGNICHEGMNSEMLRRYEIVLSGHFHHKSSRENITYVGTPGEMTWADHNDERGFHIFDTETRELVFIPNPYKMFYKIKYNDDNMQYNEIVNADYSQYTGKQIKIVIEKRNNSFMFDTLIDNLVKVNPMDVSVVEDFSDVVFAPDDVKIDEAQDTISILNSYVDNLTLPVESDKIKVILRDVYNEAIALETT